jgi:hypothetical protein
LAAGVHPGVSPLPGGSFRRVLRTQALRRGELPRTAPPLTGRLRSPPYPAAAPASTTARPSASRQVRQSPGECPQRPGRNAAHCPGRSLQPQRCFASRCAGRACGAPLTPETSASPAGLTARARPEARPVWRAANLRRSIRHLPAERRREPGTGCRSRSRLACCTAPCHAGCDATLRLGSWPG